MVQVQAPRTRSKALPHINAKPPMGHLEVETSILLHSSLSDNTHHAYLSALEQFEDFRTHFSFCESWPALVDQLSYYIAFISLRSCTYRTVCLYINAIAHLHKIMGHYDTTKVKFVSTLLKVLLRSIGVYKNL